MPKSVLSILVPEPGLLHLSEKGAATAEAILADATAAVRARIERDGKIAADTLEREQHAAHGLAWLATYVMGIRQLSAYGQRLADSGRLGAADETLIQIGLGEF
ncbi:MAG: hypothetical protein WD873_01415, partial [Candidatus Hydrogenedentales bacterium]